MSLFSRRPFRASADAKDASADTSEVREGATGEETAQAIAGDRGIPSINRARSIQSRTSSALAVTLMSVLAFGFLTWYYAKTLMRPGQAERAAQLAAKNRVRGEMALPALGPIRSPDLRNDRAPAPAAALADPSTIERLLGPAPPLSVTGVTGVGVPSGPRPTVADAARPKSPEEVALERRLAGPAFARVSKEDSASLQAPVASAGTDIAQAGATSGPTSVTDSRGYSAESLNALLRPTVTPAVTASVLPTRQFLLPKGAFIDCTLETAMDSTLPGMTTCITANDTFSADGTIVLLERGTKLVGETRGQVSQGASRIFVLWSEARTPTGVVVPLTSPGTDELGRSGLAGDVNRHFWDRFGAAILLTVVSGAVQGAVNSQSSSGSLVVSPSTSTDVMTEVLKSTVNIAPTVTKDQGDRIQVLVARDVDFRSVYALRVVNTAAVPEKTP